MKHFEYSLKKGEEPKPETEYIYRMDTAQPIGRSEFKRVKRGAIVANVVAKRNADGEIEEYEFAEKETGEIFRCTYAWAFSENTKSNKKKVAEYEEYLASVREERVNASPYKWEHTPMR